MPTITLRPTSTVQLGSWTVTGAGGVADDGIGARILSGMSQVEVVAQGLRAVLEVVESGELPAERDQVAWLRGAVAALDVVTASNGSG